MGIETMNQDTERQIYPKVVKSMECLNEAAQLFENFLDETTESPPGDYYRARNLLKEGDGFYQEALKNAKKLLGPMPEYATEEYKKWREEFLDKYHVLAKCTELEACRLEFNTDPFLRDIMTPDEIEALLNLHYSAQQEGKRKLENLKVRIILDKNWELLTHTRELQKQALVKQQQGN